MPEAFLCLHSFALFNSIHYQEPLSSALRLLSSVRSQISQSLVPLVRGFRISDFLRISALEFRISPIPSPKHKNPAGRPAGL